MVKNQANSGQGLIEFAILLPLLVLIIFGAVDLARVFFAQVTITNASREGARFAMRVNKNSQVADKLDAIEKRVVAEAGSSGVTLSEDDVSVYCGTDPYYAPCPSGTELKVQVDYEFELILSAFFLPTINLTHTTQMVTP